MTTERQIAANRANAKRSSGPKSRPGKARASRNAYRHGLAACMAINGGHVTAVHELAREIQNSIQGQIDGAGCLAIAQAELEVLRVRAVASTVFAQTLNGLAIPSLTIRSRDLEKETARPPPLGEKPSFAAGLVGGIEQLTILDRYLRRALAKRDKAVRLAFEHQFDAAQRKDE